MLKPLGKRVLLKEKDNTLKNIKGIVLSEMLKEGYMYAEVIQIGKGEQLERGNIVVLKRYDTTALKYESDDFFIADEENILGVIEEE